MSARRRRRMVAAVCAGMAENVRMCRAVIGKWTNS